MRSRLLSLALVVTALTPARHALADDGFQIKRNPVAPIAGTPLWPAKELETPPVPAKSPGLVIAGAVVASLGAAGAIAGSVLVTTDDHGCVGSPCATTRRDAGITTLLISAPVAAAGLTMMLIGIQPADSEPADARRFVPQVAIGPTGGVLTWKF
jgi:hypothetical protein